MALALLGSIVDAATVPSNCFEETATYGRTSGSSVFDVEVNDKNIFDGVDYSIIGDYPRVSLLQFCTEITSGYL